MAGLWKLAPGKGVVWVGVLSGILVVGALLWFPVIGRVVQSVGKKRVMVGRLPILFLFLFLF